MRGTSTRGAMSFADAGSDERKGTVESRWQGADDHEWRVMVVLRCVLAWLNAPDLWRCGGVCRAWRHAAADPRLWRRLLQPRVRPTALAALTRLCETQTPRDDSSVDGRSWWRTQYAMSAAQWRRRSTIATAVNCAQPSCAVLHERAPALALLRDDARLTIWSHRNEWDSEGVDVQSEWYEQWSGSASNEWRAALLARWAPKCLRLLVAGQPALTDRHEVVVIEFNDTAQQWQGRVVCRVASAGGAAPGCWVDDRHFLSLELRLLAPRQACTTLWLNAATQETQSEYVGVTSPLLRIYNESATHMSHIMVVHLSETESTTSSEVPGMTPADVTAPSSAYYKAQVGGQEANTAASGRVLITAGGARGGPRGEARALFAWPLVTPLTLPAVYVAEELADRVRRQRMQAKRSLELEHEPEPDPDERTVRALCTPPVADCPMPAQILDIVLHPSGGNVWVSFCGGGAACVSVPTLRQLLWVPPTTMVRQLTPAYYVQSAVDQHIFITPGGGGSVQATTWLVLGGTRGRPLEADAPVLAVQLLPRMPPAPHRVLLLTGNALEMCRRGRGAHTGGAGEQRSSCTPTDIPPCPPCERVPPPPCRTKATSCPSALRVVCCAPPVGQRPPCPPPPSPQQLTCQNSQVQKETTPETCVRVTQAIGSHCSANLDRVAVRLAAAKQMRRCDYEQEVAARTASLASVSKPYTLAAERQCMRATDGKDYTVVEPTIPTSGCGPCRTPPPPCPVKLDISAECEIHRDAYLDPCAHQPKVFVEIDRSASATKSPQKCPESPCKQVKKQTKSSERLTTRIIEKLRRNHSDTTVAQKDETRPKKESWCNLPLTPKAVPSPCAEPSLVERLRQRPGGTCGQACNTRREIHTKANYSCVSGSKKKSDLENKLREKTDSDSLIKILEERNQLKEAGRGRIASTDCKNSKNDPMGLGCLELPIPPSADVVRVRVQLDFNALGKSSKCSCLDSVTPYPSNLCIAEQRDSWLSLKSIHKKLSGRKQESISDPKLSSPGPCAKNKIANAPVPQASPCSRRAFQQKPRPDRPTCPPKVKFSSSEPFPDLPICGRHHPLMYLLNTI